ncbi:hypothetical protein R6Q57_025818 [Mikania cordata]
MRLTEWPKFKTSRTPIWVWFRGVQENRIYRFSLHVVSFYVGDAAGRIDDHSDADKKFAETIGLKFYLPEEYFDA